MFGSAVFGSPEADRRAMERLPVAREVVELEAVAFAAVERAVVGLVWVNSTSSIARLARGGRVAEVASNNNEAIGFASEVTYRWLLQSGPGTMQ